MDNKPIPMREAAEAKRNCTTCAFAMKVQWPPPNIGSELKCQFMPPQLVLVPGVQGPQLLTLFPTVIASQCCAQHRLPSETANTPEPQKVLVS